MNKKKKMKQDVVYIAQDEPMVWHGQANNNKRFSLLVSVYYNILISRTDNILPAPSKKTKVERGEKEFICLYHIVGREEESRCEAEQ